MSGAVVSPKYEVMGCPCEAFADLDQVERVLADLVQSGRGGFSVAINAEKISACDDDPEFRKAMQEGTLAIPDGAGAVLALRWIHGVKSLKVDLPRAVLEASNKFKWRLFVGGASESSNAGATEEIQRRYPDIVLAGRMNGYGSDEDFIAAAVAAQPQIMLLALGTPKQELMAKELMKHVPGILVIGCGGALDILAGKLTRAPRFMIDNNLEWLYRLYIEPSRWQRQLVLFPFIAKLVRETIKAKAGHLVRR